MTDPKEVPEIANNSHHHHHHQNHLVQNASHNCQPQNHHHPYHYYHPYHHSSQSPTLSLSASILISSFILTTLLITFANGAQQPQHSHIPSILQILKDLAAEEVGCGELNKDCHCGSIAQSPGSSLFTRLVYPNSSTVIEEYDDNVPYGYKLFRVYYQCADEENVLVGENFRECAEGNWRGAVPRCVFNLRNSTKLKNIKFSDYRYRRNRNYNSNSPGSAQATSIESSTSNEQPEQPINAVTLQFEPDLKMSPNGTFEIPLEEQPEKCIRWGLFPEQVWSMTLSAPARIHYVRIKLYGDKIEDLHQNRDIAFEMSLKNITYVDAPGEARREQENRFNNGGKQQLNSQLNQQQQQNLLEPFNLPNIEIRCRETYPKASQYVNSAQQKYSANYLVLDFLCEAESIQKSIFEYFFSYDYAIDQLFAGVIEIRFSMLNLKVPTSKKPSSGTSETEAQVDGKSAGVSGDGEVQHEEIELAQKIFSVRLCALKVYAFHTDCGSPDVPVNAIVQREYNFLDDNERKTYKYICNDKNQELKGNVFVECGYYSRWKNEFPQCVNFRPCELLSEIRKTNDYILDVTYESLRPAKTIFGENHQKDGIRQVVPNGKFARFRCVKRGSIYHQENIPGNGTKSTATVTPPANVKASHVMYEGLTTVMCRNGQWIGLETAVNAHHCISVPSKTVEGVDFGGSSSSNVVESSSKVSTTPNDPDDPSAVQLVSLPVRLIRILFALFIILCLIIVALLVYMCIFRQQMSHHHHSYPGDYSHGSGKSGGGVNAYNFDAFDGIGNHHLLNSSSHHLIPTIMYNGGIENGGTGAGGGSSEIIYCTESNVYERISLEHEGEDVVGGANGGPHFYQTIKIGGSGGGGGGDSNYSEMGTYPSSMVNEERENSIYGMEEDEEDDNGGGGSLMMMIPRSRRRSSAVSATDIGFQTSNSSSSKLTVVRNATSNSNNAYNQLDRSSSMFMKSNSIYENNSNN